MQASADKIWTAAQEQLRSLLSADTYNLWFAPLRPCAYDESSIVLEVANDFCEVWLKDNYLSLLQDVLGVASGQKLQIKFRVSNGSISAPSASLPAVNPAPPREAIAPKPRHAETATEKAGLTQDAGFN